MSQWAYDKFGYTKSYLDYSHGVPTKFEEVYSPTIYYESVNYFNPVQVAPFEDNEIAEVNFDEENIYQPSVMVVSPVNYVQSPIYYPGTPEYPGTPVYYMGTPTYYPTTPTYSSWGMY